MIFLLTPSWEAIRIQRRLLVDIGLSFPRLVASASGPFASALKKAGHTSGSTADSETWSLAGTHDASLKRDVIPILHQIETTLGRPSKLIGKEDNTACIAAVRRGYSPALRYLQRHAQVSLGFVHEVFHPAWEDNAAPKYLSELTY